MDNRFNKIYKILYLLALFSNNLTGSNVVLYNSSTHETITPNEIAAGGTSWILLDANNSNYSSYTHPAYYNTSVHQVLDSSSGSKVGDWILTPDSSGGNSGDSNFNNDSKVLYNTSTHETITPIQIAAGGTSWILLDANNSNYSSYTHPAYYNTSVHQVLDSSSGSKVGDWILTTDSSGVNPGDSVTNNDSNFLYNTSTHEMITPSEVAAGGTSWMLLDANDSNYSSYTHPAYYNTSVDQILDSSSGSKVGDWILTASTSSGNSNGNDDDNFSLVLYNIDTREVITPAEVATGSTVWILLSPQRYPEKYTHPAYYNLTFHAVVENVSGDIEQGWTLRDSSLIDQNSSNTDLYKVLYNTTSHQIITREQIEGGGTDWIILASGFVGNDGSTYSFPAYYNKQTHGVLDNTKGDVENGWILTQLEYEVKITSTDGGTVYGNGTYNRGENANIVAKPSTGFRFEGWSGDITNTEKSIELNVFSDFGINASFSKDTQDDDSDGLTNYDEIVIHGTDSSLVDSDQDGISDYDEINNGMNPISSDKDMVDKIAQILGSKAYRASPYTEGWFFVENRGWLYTNKAIYPYFYDNLTKGWMYFQAGGELPRYYQYDSKKWIIFDSD